MLLGILLSSAIISCASVPDVPVCTAIDEALGFCIYTITNKEFYIDNIDHLYEGKPWSQVELESLRVPASSWAEIKSYILIQCKKHKDCRDDLPRIEKKFQTLQDIKSNE